MPRKNKHTYIISQPSALTILMHLLYQLLESTNAQYTGASVRSGFKLNLWNLLSFILLITAPASAARERDFNPLNSMEVLKSGETQIAYFPPGVTCCALRTISETFIEDFECEKDPAKLYVTSLGSRFTAAKNDHGLYNVVHSPVNYPDFYTPLVIEMRPASRDKSDLCENIEREKHSEFDLKKLLESKSDGDIKIAKDTLDYYSTRLAMDKEAEFAVTFFGRGERLGETAIFRCWQPEEDALILAMIKTLG